MELDNLCVRGKRVVSLRRNKARTQDEPLLRLREIQKSRPGPRNRQPKRSRLHARLRRADKRASRKLRPFCDEHAGADRANLRRLPIKQERLRKSGEVVLQDQAHEQRQKVRVTVI